MSARVSCTACQHQINVPELGKRYTCPNCQSPFVATKPNDGAVAAGTPKRPALNKTMLGETDTPIYFSCPHCKKSIEASSIEAGSKKACPGCGQRVPVPSSSTSGEMKAVPSETSAARQELPPAHDAKTIPGGSRTLLIGGGIVAGGLALLALVACLIFAFSGGGDRQALAEAQKELEAKAAEREKINAEARLEYQLALAKKLAENAEQKRPQDKDDEAKAKTTAVPTMDKKVEPVEPAPPPGTVVVVPSATGLPVIAKLGQIIGTAVEQRSKRPYKLKFGPQPLPPGDYVIISISKLKGGPLPPNVDPPVFTLNSGATVELTLGYFSKK